MPSTKTPNLVSVWERVLDASWPGVPAEQVAALLKLKFGKTDVARVRSLGERAQEGALTRAERSELEDYLFVGNVMGTLRALVRARLGCDVSKSQAALAPARAKAAGPRRRKAT